MLLGDPQQLPQVSQGTHPEPVDTSALGWLIDGQHTLPAELGYFLDRSYRMHPTVCGAVSRLSYDGRLQSHDEVTAARTPRRAAPGVRVLTVDHDGNSTDSPEEADAIVAEIRGLLGTAWTDEDGTVPLAQKHVLVVTPYNAQVVTLRRRLDAAGLTEVEVGHRRQVPGQAGAGGVRVDDRVVGRRRASRNRVPAQPESAQRRGQPGEVPLRDRALGAADRVPARHAGPPGRAGCVPVASDRGRRDTTRRW